jgi:NitT/TauT family transport system ATP-binding protein
MSVDVMIHFEGISKSFLSQGREVVALHDVDLSIRRGEFASVVGPSGCGKTTLLRLCAGLDQATEGQTWYGGASVDGLNTRVGYITQDSNLYPWMTLRQNVEFPLELRGIALAERRMRSNFYLRMVGLEGFEDHYPYQLSGGMQKRGSIVRTMIYDPEVILMDEPFGALDAQTRMVLQGELLRIWSLRKQTILFITHDMSEAIALSDTVAVMSGRPGTIKQVFPIPISRPRDVFQIHTQAGFAETYAEVWQCFRSEVVGNALGSDPSVPVQDLPPVLSPRQG